VPGRPARYNGVVTGTLSVPPQTRRGFERLAADLRRILGDRFVALVASGPASSVVFARSLASGDLEAMGPLVESWRRDQLETPLLLTPDEFQRSLDAFPLEYQALIDRHEVIAGTPPFAGAEVEAAHLRHACEVQARSHLIHLRQGWVDASGHDEELAALIARSAEPLRALLANVARLEGVPPGPESATRGGQLAGLPDALVSDVLAIARDPQRAHALVPRLPEYLSAAERLWSFVDTWRRDVRGDVRGDRVS
jgi:hypothetical protein